MALGDWVRELTRTITQLYAQLADLVKQVAPQLLAEKGLGVLIAAKLIGEIAGIDRTQQRQDQQEAIRSLRRHLVRRVHHLLHDPNRVPITICST